MATIIITRDMLPELTEEEKQAIEKQKEEGRITGKDFLLKMKRDGGLTSSDLYMLSDFPITEEERTLWVTYRQALRDLPATTGWPDIAYADWPAAPDGTKVVSEEDLAMPVVEEVVAEEETPVEETATPTE